MYESCKSPQAAVARHVEGSVWRSANRLGVSTLDVVYVHWWDWGHRDFASAFFALRALRLRGIVRASKAASRLLDHSTLMRLLRLGETGVWARGCVLF